MKHAHILLGLLILPVTYTVGGQLPVEERVQQRTYTEVEAGHAYKILPLPIVAPVVTAIPIEECGEELVDLNLIGNKRIVSLASFDPIYNAGHNDCGKVRKGLYERLLVLLEHLPSTIGIAFFEGYRPLWKQKEYFVKLFLELANAGKDSKYSGDYLEHIYSETCKFASPFIDNIPVHCTGAAIDFTLFRQDEQGVRTLLDMGKFGAIFGPNDQAATLASNLSPEQKTNRGILLTAATRADLVNYGLEWWHCSYRDRAWAYVVGADTAKYGLADNAMRLDAAPSKEAFLQAMKEQLSL
jgi:D-alanyl-D-alanine dipeptidase